MALEVHDVRTIYENFLERVKKRDDEIIQLFDYARGHQWSAEDIEYLRGLGREARRFDIIMPQLVAYDSYLVQNEGAPKAVPWEAGDIEMAAMQTNVLQHNMKHSDFGYAGRRAGTDAWIAREGHILVEWDPNSEDYEDGELSTRRLHPISVIHDLDATSPEPHKGRYTIVREWRPIETIMEAYGNNDPRLIEEMAEKARTLFGEEIVERGLQAFFGLLRDGVKEAFSSLMDKPMGQNRTQFRENTASDYIDYERGYLLTLELHYREKVPRKRIIVPGMRPIPIEKGMEEDRDFIGYLLSQLGMEGNENAVQPYMATQTSRVAAVPALYRDRLMLDPTPHAIQNGDFPIFTYQAYDFMPDPGQAMSGVEALKDYQDRVNRIKSIQEDAITRLINRLWKMRSDSLPSNDKWLQNWLEQKPGDILVWEGDHEPKPAEGNSDLVNVLKMELEEDLNFAQNQLGLGPNMRGVTEGEKSGVHFKSRVKQGEMLQNTLFRNIRDTNQRIYEYAFRLQQKFMHAERVVRLTGRGGQKEFALRVNVPDPVTMRVMNDVTAGDYDIEWDETNMSATERQMRFEEMTEFLQFLPEEMKMFLTGPWLELSDLPQQDKLMRAWRIMLMLKYGPEVLQALEDDGALEQFIQQYTAAQQAMRAQAVLGGQAVPEGSPDPDGLNRDQFIPHGNGAQARPIGLPTGLPVG